MASLLTVLHERGWNCHYCVRTLPPLSPAGFGIASRDHIVPKSMGGPDALWNLHAACTQCNLARPERRLNDCRCLVCYAAVVRWWQSDRARAVWADQVEPYLECAPIGTFDYTGPTFPHVAAAQAARADAARWVAHLAGSRHLGSGGR